MSEVEEVYGHKEIEFITWNGVMMNSSGIFVHSLTRKMLIAEFSL